MEEVMMLDEGATVNPGSGNTNAEARHNTSQFSLQPDYSCRKVQEALEHLASFDLIDLCNEAKVELCRATRDLGSCGCRVQSVLNSCGHASLCEECSQRCDVCPICRIYIPKTGNRLSLRLYYECIEAGLISKRYDDRFQDKDGEKQPKADVERLYLFFDVALENNLLSLICHYITDVCMDERAVSSDPVVALLLDEVVVKDWCKRTFKVIIAELQQIYNLNVEDMKERSNMLLKFTVRLSSISTVLEELESSFKGSLSAQLHDIHHLQESILKTKQHTEMMIWYARHQYLEGLNRHDSFLSWRSDVRERSSTARTRAWPAPTGNSMSDGEILFIQDALSNLDTQPEVYKPDRDYDQAIASLQKDEDLSFSRAKIEGLVGSYPFKNLRSAIDILFLCGSSDMVVAKQAIFLYYLFDRLWKIPDDKWRSSVDDFSATFNIARHSILESFTFYLLDDPSEDAMKEACRLLPEISRPTTHPKVAQTLLERQNPDTALMVLRWSGSDSGPELASLNEAVTAVRVRVECGLLIEAFMYQRSICTKVKKKKARHDLSDALNGLNNDFEDGFSWLEILVTEICLLCIRRNIVDRIIGLPWNVDEEKHLHKCLLDYALEEPFTNGSLLVVFYLQRYRYVEAYQVDQKLQSLEEDFISKDLVDDDVKNRILTTQHWRAGLVAKGIQLLPDVEQDKVFSGQMTELTPPENPNPGGADRGMSNLVPSDVNSSLIFQMGVENPSPESNFGGLTNFSTHVSKVNKFGDADRGMSMLKSISKNLKFDDIITKSTTPVKEFNRGSSRIKKNKYLQNDQNESVDYLPNSSPYFGNIAANFEDSPGGINSLIKSKASGKSARLSRLGIDADVDASADLMDMTWSNKDESLPVQTSMNGGPRWRSDDADDYEDQQNLDGPTDGASFNLPSVRLRRSRHTRR